MSTTQPQGKPMKELLRIVREDTDRWLELSGMWSDLQPWQQREVIATARAMIAAEEEASA